jgi:hypothetical protein
VQAGVGQCSDATTVGFDDLETGVERLASCAHRVVPDAYHDA